MRHPRVRRLKRVVGAFGLLGIVALLASGLLPASADDVDKRPVIETTDLIIDKIVIHDTPQAGGFLMCFEAKVGTKSALYHEEGQEFDGDYPIPIETGIRIPDVKEGDQCEFKMLLDDDPEEVCADADNKSRNRFRITEKGEKVFNFGDESDENWHPPVAGNQDVEWSYTIYWHLEEVRKDVP